MKWSRLINILILASAIGPEFVAAAAPLERWHWRNPLPTGNMLYDVKYLNGAFVAEGDADTVLTSSNGLQWTRSGPTAGVGGIVFGNGIYLKGGAPGSVMTSSDLKSWVSHATGSTNILVLAYGAGVFVAAEDGQPYFGGCGLLVSTNGTNWNRCLPASYDPFHEIIYAGGRFLAVNGSDGGGIFTSTNGVDWAGVYGGLQLNDVAFGSGYFAAVGANYYNQPGALATSDDGVNWTSQQSGTPNYLNGVCCVGPGTVVAVGDAGTIIYWIDLGGGSSFSFDVSPGMSGRLFRVAYGNGIVVGVGDYGHILTSTNGGGTWTSPGSINLFDLNKIVYGNNQFVAVGNHGAILSSIDGISWTKHTSATGTNFDLQDIAFGGGIFTAVGYGTIFGTIQTSTNGSDWTQQSTSGAGSVVYGDGMFIAMAYGIGSPAVIVSSNSINWTINQDHTIPIDGRGHLAYGNGVFVGVYPGVGWSTNGTNWQQAGYTPPAVPYTEFTSVAFGNGRFVATDFYGQIITSADGRSWSLTRMPTNSNYLHCVSYGNGLFLVAGDDACGQFLLISADGTNWVSKPLEAAMAPVDFAYGAGTFVGVAAGGSIVQSEDLAYPSLAGKADASGGFAITATGEVGRGYRIQRSEDLHNWNDLFTYTNDQFSMQFLDSSATNHARNYYRAVSP